MQRTTGWKSHDLILEKDGFHDDEGRRVCFRGVNIAGNAKIPPFSPFQESHWWDQLSDWGFNMARLTLFWEAVEPEPDVYDRGYLDRVMDLVNQASQRNIYLLLDMHQDLYSRWLCGDGAPAWTFPPEVDPSRNDSFGGQFWGAAYVLSRDVRACFSHFFRSSMLREHYRNAWTEIASRVKDNAFILGYDIMNEPSCGDILNLNGEFENHFLKTLYQETIAAIREVHPTAVGFVEPHVLDMFTSRMSGFDLDGLVYAPHLYNPLSVSFRFSPLSEEMSLKTLLLLHQQKAKGLGLPLFIGEFGAPWSMQPGYARSMTVNDALEVLEGEFVDNAYWDFSVRDVKIWNEEDFSLIDEERRPRGLEVNARPYVSQLRGVPLFQHYDCYSKTFVAIFKSPPGLPPTIIKIPDEIQYPQGFRFKLSDGWAEFHQEQRELWYYPAYDGSHQVILSRLFRAAR
jgi:endoglycosylceramidase